MPSTNSLVLPKLPGRISSWLTSQKNRSIRFRTQTRTRLVLVFPNDASLLRLVSALLAEITEEWATGKLFLNMASQNPQAN